MLSFLLMVAISFIGCGGPTPADEAKQVCDCYTQAQDKEGAERSRAWKKCEADKVMKEGKWSNKGKKEDFAKEISSCEVLGEE